MESIRQPDPKRIVLSILAVFTVLGVLNAGQEADGGLVVTWVWTGIGLAVTYLLYRIALALERIVDAL